ncbi:MAG: hypothetical protein ACOWWH_12710 [Eubacteriaceae bacterium]
MSILKFTLIDNDGAVTFGTENVKNWVDLKPSITRSKSYRGRTREFTSTFQFTGSIRERIIRNYDNYGNNTFTTLKIEVGNDNRDLFSYRTIGSGYAMKADYSKINKNELTVELNFVDSEFQQDISDNEKKKLNLTLDTSLKGTTPTDYNTLLKTVWMHDRTLAFNSELVGNPDFETEYEDFGTLTRLTSFPIDTLTLGINYKSDDNIKQPFPVYTGFELNDPDIERFFYLLSDQDRTLNITFDFEFFIAQAISPATTPLDYTLSIYRYDSDYNFIEEIILRESSAPDYRVSSTGDIYNETIKLDIKEGESLLLYTVVSGLSSLYTRGASIFFNSKEYYDATISKCILPHEFFTHYIELMTGQKNAFYSEYFGRTDLGYSQDGEGAYLAIMDGYMIRNLPITEYPLNTTFNDMLMDFIKLKNLAAFIEYKGDKEVFRIEKFASTFNQQTILDLRDRYSGISRTQNDDLTYSSIKVGFKDVELEDLNGLNVVHGEVNYSTPLTGIDNELDLQLKAYSDGYLIEIERRLQYSDAPEEDGKYDKNIFIVECKKGSTTDVIAKTNEDFEEITGILQPNKAYNLGITPARIVREWGNSITGCLQKNLTDKLILTKSATNTTLVTTKTGETSIAEKDNIDIDNLDRAIMTNETIIIDESTLSIDEWKIIENNPNGIIKASNKGIDFYTTINNTNFKTGENKADFELIILNR